MSVSCLASHKRQLFSSITIRTRHYYTEYSQPKAWRHSPTRSIPAYGMVKHTPARHCFQTGAGAHQTSYPVGTENDFLGAKRTKREVKNSQSFSAEIRNAWS
jgi:hypothetical protein